MTPARLKQIRDDLTLFATIPPSMAEEAIGELLAHIDAMAEQLRWRVVPGEMPGRFFTVDATVELDEGVRCVWVVDWRPGEKEFAVDGDRMEQIGARVVAWRPRPEPYKEQE